MRCSRLPSTLEVQRTAGLLAVLCALFWPSQARAQTDYLIDNTDWNGLSTFAEGVREADCAISAPARIDLAALAEHREAILLLIYPREQLPVESLVRFVRAGGRMLIADDFGSSAELLARFGIHRRPGVVIADNHYRDQPALPIAHPGPVSHPITRAVFRVVTNHPTAFESTLPSLLTFGPERGQLLVAGEFGRGRFAALADPSVLINRMQRFGGNRRLARQLLAFLLGDDRPQHVTVTVAVGDTQFAGVFTPQAQSTSGRIARDFNRFINRINDFALTSAGMRALAIFAGTLLLAGLVLLLPWARRDIDGRWGSAVHALLPTRRGDPTRRAGAILREEFEDRLSTVLLTPGPVSAIHPRWIVERVRAKAGSDAADNCRRILSGLRNIPYTRGEVGIDAAPRLSKRRLVMLYRRCARLLADLGDPSMLSETITKSPQ
ncbi:MAG: DUF4350 domain-containing protein [Deltaproteobacteria bacterium]|nr:DUF4350 domain-containing protein [Deltaproteobacteria bacterium]